MDASLPVVATEVEADVIENGKRGMLVQPEDPQHTVGELKAELTETSAAAKWAIGEVAGKEGMTEMMCMSLFRYQQPFERRGAGEANDRQE
jgi:hypothetical protein